MTRSPSFRSAALLLLLIAAACGAFYRQPEVTLQGVQLGGLGLRGGTLLVNVRIYNPNRFTLSARSLRYQLALGDSETPGDTTWLDFASGVFERGFSVAGGDTSVVQIPVEFAYSGLGSAAASLLRSGTFNYRARGEVDVETPLGQRDVPFSKRGVITLMGTR